MKSVEQHIAAFEKLGDYLINIKIEDAAYADLLKVIDQSQHNNGWFTKINCLEALKNWGNAMNPKALRQWISKYTFVSISPKTIGLVLAGNIPLVGFHDVLSVLLCGHNATIKLSSTDPFLIPFLYQKLMYFDPIFNNRLQFTKERLERFDAVIATGSNNAARYFDHYFSKVPNIIRKNRNGVAVLTGNETQEELSGLANDIVRYYGLGCRSVSKIYVPQNYDLNLIFGALYPHAKLMDSAKYANNYDYNKAVFLMSEFELLDNGFFLFRESDAIDSPVACLHYSRYASRIELEFMLDKNKANIQCISSQMNLKNAIPLGKAQQPELWEYADGIDPLSFLLSL